VPASIERPPPSNLVLAVAAAVLAAALVALGVATTAGGGSHRALRAATATSAASDHTAASARDGADATGATAPTPGTGPPTTAAAATTAPATTVPTVAAAARPTATAPTTAPVPSPTPATAGTASLAGKVIAIDPGHNGQNWSHPAEIDRLVPAGGFEKACDTTGTATDAGYTESAFNLDVALRLASDLRTLGATVVLTRANDDGWGPCIDQRAAIANAAHANVALSIHADGGPAGGRGFDVNQPALLAGFTDAIVGPSHQLALDVRDAFARHTAMPTADYIGSGGIDTRSDLGGLNLSAVPKVLIECGNMRNATDAALLGAAAFRQQAADALAHGLVSYLTGSGG